MKYVLPALLVIAIVLLIFRVTKDKNTAPEIAIEHQTSKSRTELDQTINIEKAEGGISIAELFASKKRFEKKRVKIKGQVVKVNPMIMGKNWVHIQDGTHDGSQAGKDFDLTITTMEEVKNGQVLIFEGIITLDKDFGAGYFYNVIMEEAIIIQD